MLGRLFGGRRPAAPRLGVEDRYREILGRLAPGRRVVDVGCMWNVNGGYAFHTLDSGAAEVIGLDVDPATTAFAAGNAARGGRVRFVQGDVNEPADGDRVGPCDLVFCAGVLHHMPNPVLTLQRLGRLAADLLVLGVATIPERDFPQTAVFLPFLDDAARGQVRPQPGNPHRRVGIDTAFLPERSYSNWFWALTPSCVRAMVRTAGFAVVEDHEYPRAVCLVCRRPAGSATPT